MVQSSFVLYDEVQKDFLLLPHTYSFIIALEPPGAIQGPKLPAGLTPHEDNTKRLVRKSQISKEGTMLSHTHSST